MAAAAELPEEEAVLERRLARSRASREAAEEKAGGRGEGDESRLPIHRRPETINKNSIH